MVDKSNLLKASEVWSRTPLPALAKQTISISGAGTYVFRVTEGVDVFQKQRFRLEVRNVFGMFDIFCDKYTKDFATLLEVSDWHEKAMKNAHKEYDRLFKKFQKRVKEHERKH